MSGMPARDSALLFLLRCEARRIARDPVGLHQAEPLALDYGEALIREVKREIETERRQARFDAVDATR